MFFFAWEIIEWLVIFYLVFISILIIENQHVFFYFVVFVSSINFIHTSFFVVGRSIFDIEVFHLQNLFSFLLFVYSQILNELNRSNKREIRKMNHFKLLCILPFPHFQKQTSHTQPTETIRRNKSIDLLLYDPFFRNRNWTVS